MSIELNIDLGELADEPDELYSLATVANVACGGHAGDEGSMRRAVALASAARTAVAAHPSYADREGFGRRPHHSPTAETARAVGVQSARLAAIARDAHVAVQILKLHGALYHDAALDPSLADAVLDAARGALGDLRVVVGSAGSALEVAARARGLRFDAEAFADRRYRGGALVPRSEPDALLTDEEACVEQALALSRSGEFATLCLHSDTPRAVARARAVSAALSTAGLLRDRG